VTGRLYKKIAPDEIQVTPPEGEKYPRAPRTGKKNSRRSEKERPQNSKNFLRVAGGSQTTKYRGKRFLQVNFSH